MQFRSTLYVFILAAVIYPTISSGEDTYIDYKYFPMSTGKIYEYKVVGNRPFSIGVSTRGKEKSYNINVREYKTLQKIEKKEYIEGKDYYKLIQVYKDVAGPDPVIIYRRLAKDGRYIMKPGSKEYMDIPFPIKDGNKWEYINPDINTKVSCSLEVNNEVYVGEITYQDAIVIERTFSVSDRNYNTKEYFAANVGFVRSVTITKQAGYPDLVVEYNLVNYK